MSDNVELVDFGAPAVFGSHLFRVEIPAARGEAVRIIEDYGFKGGNNDLPYEEHRSMLPRPIWSAIADAARRDFNERLKSRKVSTGRWKPGRTLVDRLLGRELCVLAWAAERAAPGELPVICSRWAALRPEERWWLFAMTAAEAGLPDDRDRGWRKALYYALSDGERMAIEPKRRRPAIDDSALQGSLFGGGK